MILPLKYIYIEFLEVTKNASLKMYVVLGLFIHFIALYFKEHYIVLSVHFVSNVLVYPVSIIIFLFLFT